MNNSSNCDSCSGMMRNQMDMRCQKNVMMGRYSQGQMMPRTHDAYNECVNARPVKHCDNDCGDTTDTMRGKVLGMAYVPWQQFGCTYEPMQGLHAGTIFPELEKPFYGRRGMR